MIFISFNVACKKKSAICGAIKQMMKQHYFPIQVDHFKTYTPSIDCQTSVNIGFLEVNRLYMHGLGLWCSTSIKQRCILKYKQCCGLLASPNSFCLGSFVSCFF